MPYNRFSKGVQVWASYLHLQEKIYIQVLSISHWIESRQSLQSTHRPPCTLMMGLPVRVMDMSCTLLRVTWKASDLRALLHGMIARKLGFPQPFCMVRRLPIDNLTIDDTKDVWTTEYQEYVVACSPSWKSRAIFYCALPGRVVLKQNRPRLVV